MGVIKLKTTVAQITVNTLEDILSSDLPSFMSCDVAEDLMLFAKRLFDQEKIRKPFINDSKYEVQ